MHIYLCIYIYMDIYVYDIYMIYICVYVQVEYRVVDFNNLKSESFVGSTAAFCCLGTTRAAAGSKEGFRKVDFEYVQKSADELRKQNCLEYHLLTAQGANPNSMFYYSQVKGEIEKCVENMNFNKLFIYRPALLLCERKESRPFERFLRGVANSVDWGGKFSVNTTAVAAVMVDNLQGKQEQQKEERERTAEMGSKKPEQQKEEKEENRNISIWEHGDIVKKAKEIMETEK
eukprot:GHVS01006888.1.p1 GENE.GHVS01006888.1~~GHVS01006888.1.p1  ORF type:complete len:231 (-),score=54.08 GHVS01006888.1:182-874(-)